MFDPVFVAPGTIRMISVDHDGDSIRVPLFVQFLRQRTIANECVICTDEFFEVGFGSAEQWLSLCAFLWRVDVEYSEVSGEAWLTVQL